MSMVKNKLLLASPLIALVVMFIFSLVLYPSTRMQPQNLPIVLVNLDEGVTLPDGSTAAMGDMLAGKLRQGSEGAAVSPVIWADESDEEAAREGLDEQKYYAAVVIPNDFSARQASLRTPSPERPELEVLVNQGMNATAAAMITQALRGMTDAVNAALSAQLVQELEASGAMLSPSQAAMVASPVAVKLTYVNETGASAARGNAPISLFQPIWMAGIAGAAIASIAAGQASGPAAGRKNRLIARLIQAAMGVVIAVPCGYGMAWLADAMLKLDVPDLAGMGAFISLAILAFFLMISAVLSWTGLRGIVLFVVLMFFGAPLLSLPPEFMNGFYRDWIHSWLPMRFLVEGLRELFFFGGSFGWNGPAATLAAIGAGSLIVLLLSAFKPAGSGAASAGGARRQEAADLTA